MPRKVSRVTTKISKSNVASILLSLFDSTDTKHWTALHEIRNYAKQKGLKTAHEVPINEVFEFILR